MSHGKQKAPPPPPSGWREPRYGDPAVMFWWRKALARLIHVPHLDVSPGEAARFAAVVAKMRGRVLAKSQANHER